MTHVHTLHLQALLWQPCLFPAWQRPEGSVASLQLHVQQVIVSESAIEHSLRTRMSFRSLLCTTSPIALPSSVLADALLAVIYLPQLIVPRSGGCFLS